MLFLFEGAREIAVIVSNEGAQPSALAHIFNYEGYTVASGRWKRIDGGDALVPSTVTIQCRRELGQCVEASTAIHDKFVSPPELDWFDATFSSDAVTYENDSPDCARYLVRIDLKMKKAFAVRDRKDKPSNPNCANLESRVEMQISDGFQSGETRNKGRFLPLLSILEWASR